MYLAQGQGKWRLSPRLPRMVVEYKPKKWAKTRVRKHEEDDSADRAFYIRQTCLQYATVFLCFAKKEKYNVILFAGT